MVYMVVSLEESHILTKSIVPNVLNTLEYIVKSLWINVIWSDESKFNLFGSDGKIMVWRTTNEDLDPKCTVPTVDVKCWGCFSLSGVGNLVFINGNMTAELIEIYYKRIYDNQRRKMAMLGGSNI